MLSERWAALSARIEGIAAAASLEAGLRVNSSDTFGVLKTLGARCAESFAQIGEFVAEFAEQIPPSASEALNAFVQKRGTLFAAAGDDAEMARAAIALLVLLRSEIDHLLADRQVLLHSRTERAFLHLQRLLAVDREVQAKWISALEKRGEVGCEQLGSAHLLWHGIFAFKINAAGARTDLVFPAPIDVAGVAAATEGLVLTEWKLADGQSATDQFASARRQSDLYQRGALAGLELTRYRYLVAVSREALPAHLVPPDDRTAVVIYRHINVVLEPKVPSVAARNS